MSDSTGFQNGSQEDMNMDNNKNQIVVKNIGIVAQRWTSSGLQGSLLRMDNDENLEGYETSPEVF